MILVSLILNIAVIFFFIVACSTFTNEMRRGKRNVKAELVVASRFFTVQSNAFASVVSLWVMISDLCVLFGIETEIPFFVVVLKLMSTTCLMLTFLVVLCYLLPTFGMTDLFQGANFYMHLVTPLLSLFSFLLCEGRYAIPLPYFLFPLIPVAAYAVLYIYKVIFTDAAKGRWDDMYLFNANGKWHLIVIVMLLITAGISVLLTLIHNLILG